VQRPGVLETVTIDLYIIRRLGVFLRRFPALTTDVVALLDEWAARFFEELDYVREARNADLFAQQMARDLPQVRGWSVLCVSGGARGESGGMCLRSRWRGTCRSRAWGQLLKK
jgi:hypothetical protein